MLLVSQGVPMILMGDEIGRTQHGNNNTYCHDNELNWLDWTPAAKTTPTCSASSKKLIAFRQAHPVLRNRSHFRNQDYIGSGYADITWHGTRGLAAGLVGISRSLAFMLCGKHAKGGTVEDDYIYVAMNMHWESHDVRAARAARGQAVARLRQHGWPRRPRTSGNPGSEPVLSDQEQFFVGPRSVAILVGK